MRILSTLLLLTFSSASFASSLAGEIICYPKYMTISELGRTKPQQSAVNSDKYSSSAYEFKFNLKEVSKRKEYIPPHVVYYTGKENKDDSLTNISLYRADYGEGDFDGRVRVSVFPQYQGDSNEFVKFIITIVYEQKDQAGEYKDITKIRAYISTSTFNEEEKEMILQILPKQDKNEKLSNFELYCLRKSIIKGKK